MWLSRGVHHLAPAKIERFIREGRHHGWEFYVLPETRMVKSWSFERGWLELPEVPLEPPNSQVGDRDWGDSFFDSLLHGVLGITGQKVGLVWPVGSITAERDPEEYARAITFLGWLHTWFAKESGSEDRKEIVVLVPR